MPTPASPNPPQTPPSRPAFYSTAQLPTSPKPENELWRGVIISAPAKATLSRSHPMLMLSGFFRIQGASYPKNDRRKVTAVDIATKKEYTAFLGQKDSNPDDAPPPRQPPDPEVVKRMVFSQYFNSDIMAALGLPWANATYKVRVDLGDIRSNEIVVQVVVE